MTGEGEASGATRPVNVVASKAKQSRTSNTRHLPALGWRDLARSFNEVRTRGRRVEPIGEILRFVGHQSLAEFHNAHRVRWYAVIGKYEFSDPEIAAAEERPPG